jgi:hypothetical protein
VSLLASNGLDWSSSKFGNKVDKGRNSSGKWFAGMKFGGVKDLVKLEIAWKAKLKGSRVNNLYDLKRVNESNIGLCWVWKCIG